MHKSPPLPNQPRPPIKKKNVAAIILSFTLTCAMGAPPLASSPAAAVQAAVGLHGNFHTATTGPGRSGITPYGGFLGSYIVADGSKSVCIDSPAPWPSGATDGGTVVSSLVTFDGDTVPPEHLARLNYAQSVYGQSDDPDTAAAASAYAYAFTSRFAHSSGTGYAAGTHYINGDASVQAIYNTIWNDTEANWNLGGGTRNGSLTFTVDNNNYVGTVRVAIGAVGGSATITLTNGIFTSTGTNRATGVTNGAVLSVQGTPPDGSPNYKISGHAEVTAPGPMAAEVVLYTTGTQQRTIKGTGKRAPVTYSFDGSDPFNRSNVFAPIVGTTVGSKFVEAGTFPQDILTFSTTNFSSEGKSVSNGWKVFASGNYVVVKAEGTLYGPWPEPFVESDVVPAGVPVAGHGVVTTSRAQGPTVTYTMTSDTPAPSGGGYYTWVQQIVASSQGAATQDAIPKDYSFKDRFGRVAETSIVPMPLTFSTTLTDTKAVIGSTLGDVITPKLMAGEWLKDSAGKPIAVTATGIVYYSKKRPVQSPTPPADAVKIGEVTQVIDGVKPVTSPSFEVGELTGYLTVQWSIKNNPFFEDWSDDYGVPSETALLVGPISSTVAQPLSAPDGTVHDTVTVTGPIPPAGVEVTFAGYLQPPSAKTPMCSAETLIYSSSKPITIKKEGTYTSENFAVTKNHLGKVFWVETTKMVGSGTIISQGECGISTETSLIAIPKISSVAVSDAVINTGTAHDDAIVDGFIPDGYTVSFTAYLQPAGSTTPVCTPETKVFDTSTKPIKVTPGENVAAKYSSPPLPDSIVGEYWWIEALHDAKGVIVAKGFCGAPNEKTVLTLPPPPLPKTGSDLTLFPLWLFGGSATGLVLLGGVIFSLQRRKTKQP